MSSINIKKHISILGLPVRDRVTGLKGIAASVTFDLYGCVQAIVQPLADKNGKVEESKWFDIARLEVLDKTPVMEVPNFEVGYVAEGKKGPAEKPKGKY